MKIALILISLFFSATTLACECLWQGPFKTVYTEADLVVYGEVGRSQGNGFDLSIKEIIQGSEYREQIRIWGKKDNLCRPEAKEFPSGSQWIMALHRIDNPPADAFNPFKANISFGRQDDFSLSSCGVYWLPVKEERVSGNILDGSRWQYIDPKKTPVIMAVFKAWLQKLLPDEALAEAARPQSQARKLLNETKMFLWEDQRNLLPEPEQSSDEEFGPIRPNLRPGLEATRAEDESAKPAEKSESNSNQTQ
ncbi:hypothetical protein AB4876_15285 [Zhongshania guokunii]|uniref:Delta-aminolevulinic acid dehydratase n=1 Tax=Zhongshania guokunii TaxID=641783 RepID=A0ABV3U8J8_9GAMM